METLKALALILNPLNWIRSIFIIVALGKAVGGVFIGNPYFLLWRN